MAVHVLQSQSLDILFQHLFQQIQQQRQQQSIFTPIQVVVSSHGIGQWLKQHIAREQGIHANIDYPALRTLQWQLYQQILGQQRVAAAPQMLNMKWKIFLFLQQFWRKTDLAPTHPLQPIFQQIHQHYPQTEPANPDIAVKQQNMLYWVADQCSRLFANYMIYRGECIKGCAVGQCSCRQNWLASWGKNQPLSMDYGLLRDEQPQFPTSSLPEETALATPVQAQFSAQKQHQLQRATNLEAWQRFVWYHAFAEQYQDMQAIDLEFWQALSQSTALQQRLPKQIYLFTVLELPPAQLLFLQKLGQYCQILVLHYSPSQQYFADSVDPRWKAKFSLERPEMARYYDSHHALLTRLGKQARDQSALLMQLSGGDFGGEWIDDFAEIEPTHLLAKLQADILDLAEQAGNHYQLDAQDRSIQIHVCHSTLRQLEVLKERLLHWLDDADAKARHEQRQPSDILVLVPDIEQIAPLIRTVFARQYEQYQGYLPIKISGIAPLDAVQLWQAIQQRMQLVQQRFSLTQFLDWLSLLPIQRHYQLNYEQIQRIQALLSAAGFRRGFDEQHLTQHLSVGDEDYRFSFLYALQRLSYAIAVPARALFQQVLGLSQVQREDFALIATLLQIYRDLDARRDWLSLKNQHDTVEEQLARIEQEILPFQQHAGFAIVDHAVKNLRRILRLSLQQHTSAQGMAVLAEAELRLPLQYLLDEISNSIAHQVGQTEPTGQITFAQIGQLRPLPYRLIVCLNLDAGVFPNRDHRIPFDLMAELRGELGDRSRLEDDHGAFLDALLQAKEGFWLFYNGFDAQSQVSKEASSIVQELWQHLDLLLAKQASKTIVKQGVAIPEALQSLFYVHRLQAFSAENFQQNDPLSYQTQWYQVAEQLYVKPTEQPYHWRDQDATLPEQLDYIKLTDEQWIRDVIDPAKHFVRCIGVTMPRLNEQNQDFESLNLNALERYQVQDWLNRTNQQRMQNHASQDEEAEIFSSLSHHLQDMLPIGKMQQPTWQAQQFEYFDLYQQTMKYGGQTACESRQWHYPQPEKFNQQAIEFTLKQPINCSQWVRFSVTRLKGKRWLADWLSYLLWRASDPSPQEFRYVHVYKDADLILEAVSQQEAIDYLAKWLQVWFLAQQKPFVLPPEVLLNSSLKWEVDADFVHYVGNYQDLIQKWLYPSYTTHDYDEHYYQNHLEWQWLLNKDDAEKQFNIHMQQYAYMLYFPIVSHSRKIVEKDR